MWRSIRTLCYILGMLRWLVPSLFSMVVVGCANNSSAYQRPSEIFAKLGKPEKCQVVDNMCFDSFPTASPETLIEVLGINKSDWKQEKELKDGKEETSWTWKSSSGMTVSISQSEYASYVMAMKLSRKN